MRWYSLALKTNFFNSPHCPWNEIQTFALVYTALLAKPSGLIFWYFLSLTMLQLPRPPLSVLSSLGAFALADPVPGLPAWILSGGQLLCIPLASAQPSLLKDIALPLAQVHLIQPVTPSSFSTTVLTSCIAFKTIILTCLFMILYHSYLHTS